MFLIQRGARVLLLHSQRDGDGHLQQRRIHVFADVASLRRRVEDWSAFQDEIGRRCPEVPADWERLRQQAEHILATAKAAPEKEPRLLRATRSLAEALNASYDDPAVLQQAYRELRALGVALRDKLDKPLDARLDRARALLEQGRFDSAERLLEKIRQRARARLPKRRFDPGEDAPKDFLATLDLLAELLASRARYDEAVAVLEERLARCDSEEARLALALALHRAGRLEEAIEQYQRLPSRGAVRFYNEAAARFQQGARKKALLPILRALARDARPVKKCADYWELFGDLWSTDAREFLHSVAAEPMVRSRLRRLPRPGARVTRLIPKYSFPRLMERLEKPRRPRSSPMTEVKLTPFPPPRPTRPRRKHPRGRGKV